MNFIRLRSEYYQSLLETITKITYFRYIRYKRNKENKKNMKYNEFRILGHLQNVSII